MKKKWISMVLCIALGVQVLSGCGAAETGEKSGKAHTSKTGDTKDTANTDQPDSGKQIDTKEKKTKSAPEDVYVFIAASLSNAMEEIKVLYQEVKPNTNIIYNADSSGTLQTQIEEGAQCDIFFSAATKQMKALSDGGFTDEASSTDLLENKVVLIKPKGEKTAVTGFENIMEASSLALAGENVPVGQYARKIFGKLGITEQVMDMEINEGANVTTVLTSVGEKSNEVGIVYATDAISVRDSVEVIAEASADMLEEPVLYPVGLIRNEQAKEGQKASAESFYQFLQTEKAAEVFVKYGFTIAGK